MDPQPLAAQIWDAHVRNNFKPPSVMMFNGKSDTQDHIIAINTQMVTIKATDFLKYKLMKEALKEASLR